MSSFFSSWTYGDWISAAVMLGIAVGIGFVVRHYYLRWREEQETQAESERLFFEEAEREIQTIDPRAGSGPQGLDMARGLIAPAPVPQINPAPAAPADSQASQPIAAGPLAPAIHQAASAVQPAAAPAPPVVPSMPTVPSAPAGESKESDSLAVFISKLRQLGIFQEQEGTLALPPPSPSAAIWRMRSGGLALVLDRMESEVFLAHQAQRFRLILIRNANGKPLVVRRFEDFLTEQIEGPEAFDHKN